jgi:hypothetical protein
MATAAIHRRVEQQAAAAGETIAIEDAMRSLTYRELNAHANAVARELMASGFRRGRHAVVVLEPGPDLAIVLLAVLKAGGCYTWLTPSRACGWPRGVSMALGSTGGKDQREDRYVTLPLASRLETDVRPCPNLPVLTRGCDAATIVKDADGMPLVVTHAEVVGLRRHARRDARWRDGVLDLWVGLMAGATLTLVQAARAAA